MPDSPCPIIIYTTASVCKAKKKLPSWQEKNVKENIVLFLPLLSPTSDNATLIRLPIFAGGHLEHTLPRQRLVHD